MGVGKRVCMGRGGGVYTFVLKHFKNLKKLQLKNLCEMNILNI